MQGKVKSKWVLTKKVRITPACAGKSFTFMALPIDIEDHPCVCREKFLKVRFKTWLSGSPLRVQGKVDFTLAMAKDYRITPACAGKSTVDVPHGYDE